MIIRPYTLMLFLAAMAVLLVSQSRGQEKMEERSPHSVFDTTMEVTVHPGFPRYSIAFHFEDAPEDDRPFCRYTVVTRTGRGRVPVDTGTNGTWDVDVARIRELLAGRNDSSIRFADVNLDGYLDIQIPVGRNSDGSGAVRYNAFLFDPRRKKFRYNLNYDDITSDARFDPAKKQIAVRSATVKECASCWEERVYRVLRNRPVLVQVETSELVKLDGVTKRKLTMEKRIKGELRVVNVQYLDESVR